MKFQASIKSWATKIMGYSILSLNEVQNGQFIIKILHKIQPASFRSDWTINQRSSNSLNNIMKQISSYYKRELGENISSIIDNINVFKSVFQVWELLVGIAVKGKNRDFNINIILQMEQELQSQLMSFVEQIIQKYGQEVYDEVLSAGSGQNNRKRSSSIQQFNETNQFLAELMEQVQTLKEKNIQLITDLDVFKFSSEQTKRDFEQRIQKYKNQRYDFLQVISNYNGQSKASSISNDSSDDFCFSVTGSLPQIAHDLLNVIKAQKKENHRYLDKIMLLEQINKDLKQAYHRMTDENSDLRNQMKVNANLEQEIQKLRFQNTNLSKCQNDLIKKINQIQEQKYFLREIIQKNKTQNQSRLIMEAKLAQNNLTSNKSQVFKSGMGVQAKKQANLDFLKIPKMITKNLSQISAQQDPQYLSKEIDQIRQPLIRSKLQKQIKYLKQSIQQLKQQNQSLKSINSILQDTIHESTKKTSEIHQSLNQQFSKFLTQQQNRQIKTEINQNISPFQVKYEQAQNNHDQKQQVEQQIKFTIKVSYQQKQISSEEFIIQDKQLSPKKLKNESQFDYQINIKRQQQNKTSLKYIKEVQQPYQINIISNNPASNKKQQPLLKSQKFQNANKLGKSDQNIKRLYINMKSIIQKYQNRELVLRIQIQALRRQVQSLNQQIKSNGKSSKAQIQILKQNTNNNKSQYSKPYTKQATKYQEQSSFFQTQQTVPMIKITPSLEKLQRSMKKSEYGNYYNYQAQKIQQTQFNEIKQGEDLNQFQLSAPVRTQIKSHIFNMNSEIANGMMQKNMQKSTLQFLKPRRASRYNESFMELNNRLQSELEAQVQNLMTGLNFKSSQNKGQKTEQMDQMQKNKQYLLQKLNQIKSSTSRLSQMYEAYLSQKQRKSKDQAENFINKLQNLNVSQTRLQKQEIASLKILNEGLRKLVNQMISQKQAAYYLISKLKETIAKSSLCSQQIFTNLFSQFQSLQRMKVLPELQSIMQKVIISQKQSKQKISFYEQLYSCQKNKNQSLSTEINLLMESMVIFRNMALDN